MNQQTGMKTAKPKPRVRAPMNKPPTIMTAAIKKAPRTVEYSMPSGPNRNAKMNATPADFCRPNAITVVTGQSFR